MKGRRAGPELCARILAEVIDRDLSQVDLCEVKRFAPSCGFRAIVDDVNEYTHPLIARPMGVNRTTCLAGGLYFDTMLTCLNRVVRMSAFDDEIRVPVEIAVQNQDAGVFPEASVVSR